MSSSEDASNWIDGPYSGDHLYGSIGRGCTFFLFSLVLLGLALIIALAANQANAGQAEHIKSGARVIEYHTKLAQTKKKAAMERIKQSHLTTFYAQISAYTAVETCGSTCTMSNGQEAYYGSIACPRRLALGTTVNIEGLGVFVCADRTAQWVDGRFDVFFGYTQEDYQRAKQWGVQTRLVTINNTL